VIDRTRVAHPKNKPRVERVVSYVRESFFKGEDFKVKGAFIGLPP